MAEQSKPLYLFSSCLIVEQSKPLYLFSSCLNVEQCKPLSLLRSCLIEWQKECHLWSSGLHSLS